MKSFFRRYICLFLCLCMIVQPMLIQALYAEDVKVYENGLTRSSVSSTIKDAANQTQSNLNNAQSLNSEAYNSSGVRNASDTAKKDDALEKSAKASDELNKNQSTASGISSLGDAANAATMQNNTNSVGEMTSETAGIQDTLIKIGKKLIEIGQTLKTVGQALQAVGVAMQAFPPTAPAGKALETVGKTLYSIGTVLETVGQALVKTGEIAAGSDDLFGTLLGNVTDAVKTGWKKGSEEADAYSAQLNSKLSKNNPSASQENSSSETKDSNSETTKDAEQGDIADI